MALLLRLEDFDSDAPQATDALRDMAALPGYDAGFAAGQAAAQDAQSRVDAALVQTLSEMAFGFAEARQHILTGLAPLFSALIDQVLPNMVDEAFRARLLETLHDIAKGRVSGAVRLIVHPDQVAAVAGLMPAVTGIDIDLHNDPAIGLHGALISHGTAEYALDLDDLITQINDVLSALFDITEPQQETSQHG